MIQLQFLLSFSSKIVLCDICPFFLCFLVSHPCSVSRLRGYLSESTLEKHGLYSPISCLHFHSHHHQYYSHHAAVLTQSPLHEFLEIIPSSPLLLLLVWRCFCWFLVLPFRWWWSETIKWPINKKGVGMNAMPAINAALQVYITVSPDYPHYCYKASCYLNMSRGNEEIYKKIHTWITHCCFNDCNLEEN